MKNINSQKPKLCYIAPQYDTDDATHFSHLFDFVEEISKHYDIFLIIEKGGMPETDFGCTNIAVIPSLPFLSIMTLKFRIFQARFLGYKDFYVHYSFKSAWIAACVTRIASGRVLYWNCGEPWKYKRGFLRELFERMVYKAVTHIVTGTEGLKKKYAEIYRIPEEKIRVMPNWISLKRFLRDGGALQLKIRLGISPASKVILFAHRLSRRKGAQYLPRIAEALKHERATIVVVGEGPEKQNLELRTKNLELENKIKFIGAIPNHEMPIYYSLADIFIMPSDEEGFPRVILESMAMGVPFVAFDVGGVKEFIPQELRQYIIPYGDIEQFARAVRELLTAQPEKMKELQDIEQKAVKQFETKEVAKRFYEIIAQKNEI